MDLALGGTEASSTSGCEAGDFAGFTPRHIALIQRGACTFILKVQNAEAAGAVGALIFNQGNGPGRMRIVAGRLFPVSTVPVLFTSYDVGVALQGTRVRMSVTDVPEPATLGLIGGA